MCHYTKQSLEMVKRECYLDKLLDIYPPDEISREKKIINDAPDLKDIFEKKDNIVWLRNF